MSTNSSNCFLCGDLEIHGGYIAESLNFKLLTDISPLMPGHLLISTKNHYRSLSRLSMGDLVELSEWVDQVREILVAEYGGGVVFFEHGMSDKCSVNACGIDHAHLHALPLIYSKKLAFGEDFEHYLAGRLLGLKKLSKFHIFDYRHLKISEGSNYLFLHDTDGCMRIFITQQQFPSQLLRRYISEKFNCLTHYNWRLSKDEAQAQEMTKYLRGKFS